MRWFIGFFVTGMIVAQENAPVGIVRGDLSMLLVRAGRGTLDITTASGTVYQCDFDTGSLVERDNLPIAPAVMVKGDPIELLADRKRDRCYARIIRVLRKGTGVTPAITARSKWRFPTHSIDHIYPRGNLTFSGLIIRKNPSMLVLKTRTEPEKVIMLRDDTRFLDSGLPGDVSNLVVNTRVFIRGSKTFEDTLEAHQVIWGEIAGPKSPRSF